MGLRGLWVGISCGVTAAAALTLTTFLLIDFDREADKARERLALISQEQDIFDSSSQPENKKKDGEAEEDSHPPAVEVHGRQDEARDLDPRAKVVS